LNAGIDLLDIRRWAFLVAGLVWLVLALTAPPLQAACPPTKKALLWEVSRGDRAPGYLFGTYHLSAGDDRFERPMALARVALASAKTAAFELDLAEPGLNETLGQAMVATDGPHLDQLLGAELFAQALPLLGASGIPHSVAHLIKPWAAGIVLIAPKARKGPPMD